MPPKHGRLRQKHGELRIALPCPHRLEGVARRAMIEESLGTGSRPGRAQGRCRIRIYIYSAVHDHDPIVLARVLQRDKPAAHVTQHCPRIAREWIAITAGTWTDHPHNVAWVTRDHVDIAVVNLIRPARIFLEGRHRPRTPA